MTNSKTHKIRAITLIPWLHALTLAAVILQPSQPATILGRYSTTAASALLALLITLPLAVWGSRWLERRLAVPFTIPSGIALVGLLGCALGMAAAGRISALTTTSYIVLALYGIAMISVAALLIVERTNGRLVQGLRWLDARLLIALLAVLLIFQIELATRYPGQLWTDEGYNTALSLSIARTGEIAVPFFRLTPELFGPNYSLTYRLAGIVLNTFGVELAYARLAIYAIGLLAIGIAAYVATRRSSWRVGLALALLATIILLPNNLFRADIEVAFWLALALWAYWRAEKSGRRAWVLLAGLAVGLSLDGHPNAYRFPVVFVAFEGIDWLISSLRSRRFVLQHNLFPLAFGAALGVGAYVLLYSALVPDAFGRRLGEASLGISLENVWAQLQAQVISGLHQGALFFGVAAAGLVAALYGGRWELRLVFVALGSMVVFALTYRYYRDYYFVHLLPVYLLLAAAALGAVEQQTARGRVAIVLLALLLGIAAFTWQEQKVSTNSAQDYGAARTVADAMRPLIPREATFLAADPLYLRMSDYPNFIEFNSGLSMALRQGISEREAWARIDPDAIAIFQNYPIPPPDSLLAYVRDEGYELGSCWQGSVIGRVDLYLRALPDGITTPTDCVNIGS
jgi:hypothetical protein